LGRKPKEEEHALMHAAHDGYSNIWRSNNRILKAERALRNMRRSA